MQVIPNNLLTKVIHDERNDVFYRVYYVDGETIFLCQLHTDKLIITAMQLPDLITEVAADNISFIDDPMKVVNLDSMSLTKQAIFQKKCNFINALEQEYGPTWHDFGNHEKKSFFEKAASDSGINLRSARRIVAAYLQSGKQLWPLADQL